MKSDAPRPVSSTHERALLDEIDAPDKTTEPDKTDEQGEQSFPASDAPSSWSGPPRRDPDEQEGARNT